MWVAKVCVRLVGGAMRCSLASRAGRICQYAASRLAVSFKGCVCASSALLGCNK